MPPVPVDARACCSSLDTAYNRAMRNAGPLPALAVVLAALACLPVVAVVGRGLAPAPARRGRTSRATVLPRYVVEYALLVVLVGAGVAIGGTATGWLVARRRFPGSRFFAWALLLPLAMPSYVMAYAYTDFLQYAGPVQIRAARDLRLDARRLLVSGRALAAGRRRDVRLHAVSLRLPARAHRVPRAAAGAGRGGAHARSRSPRGVLARRAAARAAGDRRRHRAGADGDARRLRHRRLLRRRHVHDRHLSRVVLAGRPHRGRAARHAAAGVRRRRASRSSARRAARRVPPAAPAARPVAPMRDRTPARVRAPARDHVLRDSARSSASSCPVLLLLRLLLRRGRRRVHPRFFGWTWNSLRVAAIAAALAVVFAVWSPTRVRLAPGSGHAQPSRVLHPGLRGAGHGARRRRAAAARRGRQPGSPRSCANRPAAVRARC